MCAPLRCFARLGGKGHKVLAEARITRQRVRCVDGHRRAVALDVPHAAKCWQAYKYGKIRIELCSESNGTWAPTLAFPPG